MADRYDEIAFDDVRKGDAIRLGRMWRAHHPVIAIEGEGEQSVIVVERGRGDFTIRITRKLWDVLGRKRGGWSVLR